MGRQIVKWWLDGHCFHGNTVTATSAHNISKDQRCIFFFHFFFMFVCQKIRKLRDGNSLTPKKPNGSRRGQTANHTSFYSLMRKQNESVVCVWELLLWNSIAANGRENCRKTSFVALNMFCFPKIFKLSHHLFGSVKHLFTSTFCVNREGVGCQRGELVFNLAFCSCFIIFIGLSLTVKGCELLKHEKHFLRFDLNISQAEHLWTLMAPIHFFFLV